jgi:hypothetical protein
MPGYDDSCDPAVIAALLNLTDAQREALEPSTKAQARQLDLDIADQLGPPVRDRAEDAAIMREVYQGVEERMAALEGHGGEAAKLLADPVADLLGDSKLPSFSGPVTIVPKSDFPDPFAGSRTTISSPIPTADQIISLARTKKHRAGMTPAEEDEYREANDLPARLGDVDPGDLQPLVVDPDGPLVVGKATPLDVSGVPSKIKPIDLRSGVPAQLTSPKYRTFHSIRRHPPRTGKRIVIVSGDGSPEGTHFEFEGSEAPGPVMGINIVVNVADCREMASGVVTCMVNGEARPIPVWVRFGEHPIHAELQSSEPSGSAPSTAVE